MKKLLVVLLALGLIVAFSMTASAADVKFSGQYYVTGQYENNRSFSNADNIATSTADIWQRARVNMAFKVAEGLSFTTQFDALEKMWGNFSQTTSTYFDRSNSRVNTAGIAIQESIEFEQAYVTFDTAVGRFQIGYQDAEQWGTGFANYPNTRPRAMFTMPLGPVFLTAVFEKYAETTNAVAGGLAGAGLKDADGEKYMLNAVYKGKALEAGLLYVYEYSAYTRPLTANGGKAKVSSLSPYMKATFGPVYVEGEVAYAFGNYQEYDVAPAAGDMKATGWGAYLLAKMNLGPAYVGASFGLSTGDDPSTADKYEAGPKSSTQWSPGLLFGDANYRTWIGGSNPGGVNNGASFDSLNKRNIVAYNVFAGFNPTPKLNIDAQIWLLKAETDQLTATTKTVSKSYGTEFDVTATYKIYDNLSYMVGAGYLWTGDYFKGPNQANTVGNNYLLLNKLELTF